jgi:hypothetical protein
MLVDLRIKKTTRNRYNLAIFVLKSFLAEQSDSSENCSGSSIVDASGCFQCLQLYENIQTIDVALLECPIGCKKAPVVISKLTAELIRASAFLPIARKGLATDIRLTDAQAVSPQNTFTGGSSVVHKQAVQPRAAGHH